LYVKSTKGGADIDAPIVGDGRSARKEPPIVVTRAHLRSWYVLARMSTIRVGFHAIGGSGWMGGRNYLWNLLHALSLVEEGRLRPVLVASDGDGDELSLPGVERFTRRGLLDSSPAHVLGNLGALLGCNRVQQHWLRRATVDVFSHGVAPLGARARVPWIYWIPDLQHFRRPEYFSAAQRLEREWMFRTALDHAAAVMVSSEASRQDLLAAYGQRAARVRVLRDVSSPRVAAGRLPALDDLRRRLAVPARYLYLPNQFWKHKNHVLVVEALAEATRREPHLTVVATGAKDDPRHPQHYDHVISRVRQLRLQDRFRHLGLVEYDDVIGLMRHSVAVLNPSYFEGWSSSVEEARSIGKRILLSDIDAHREQAPPRGRFFSPDNPAALADLLVDAWQSLDAEEEERASADAARLLPERIAAYGRAYQDLVVDTIGAA
jgi:glycosyltransferase involved in cell wall biosynthesis